MITAFCLRIAIVSIVAIHSYPVWVTAQACTKKAPRQKVVAQKKSAQDSVLRTKIDSQLFEALAQFKKREKADVETIEPANVGADSSGNLSVDISATISDSLLYQITSLGGKIIYPSKVYRTVRAIVNLAVVKTIALRQDVSFIRPAVQAHNNAGPQPRLLAPPQ